MTHGATSFSFTCAAFRMQGRESEWLGGLGWGCVGWGGAFESKNHENKQQHQKASTKDGAYSGNQNAFLRGNMFKPASEN